MLSAITCASSESPPPIAALCSSSRVRRRSGAPRAPAARSGRPPRGRPGPGPAAPALLRRGVRCRSPPRSSEPEASDWSGPHNGARLSIERETPLVGLDHEELVVRKGRRTGVYTVVAVHSTVLGPSLGGCRLWRYADPAAATRDALRLSRAMTFKAAAAGLSPGGGKGVICAEPGDAPSGRRRRELLLDFADTVNALEGRYVTAEDVGTGSRDMTLIARECRWVSGLSRRLGGSGDPSPYTALGVEHAIRACCQRRFGTRDLEGVSVAVVGLG